jgi:hypothetical protein
MFSKREVKGGRFPSHLEPLRNFVSREETQLLVQVELHSHIYD